jgi:hypothetical protein
MIYQLGTLEKWSRKDINPESLLSATESILDTLIDFATGEKETICNYFRDKAIGKPPIPTIKFIQAHQAGITAIIDILIEYKKSDRYEVSEAIQDFYLQICSLFDEILQFIRQHLPEYFDDSFSITHIQAEIARRQLSQQLKQLSLLEQNPHVDRVLFRMATLFIRHFIEEKRQISYTELRYSKELISRLHGLLDLDTDADYTYEIHLILFQLNFNFPRYVLHYSYWLDSQLSIIPERSKRLDKLSWHIHAIEQIRPKPGYILFPDLPLLSEQLLKSIRTTYQYLLIEDKTVNHTIVEQISTKPVTLPKIQLSISVSLLALLLKAFIRSGIIVNENKADVFRLIAEHFTTRKAEKISYESLRGKYNNTPPAAYQQLRGILAKMLEFVKAH